MFSSIKNRILVFVVVFELLAYSTIQLFNNVVYEDALTEQKNAEIRQTFAASVEKINNISQLMERNAMDLASYGEHLYAMKKAGEIDIAAMSRESERILVSNFSGFPQAIGGGIWYEPYVLDGQTRYFGPYAYQDQQAVVFSWDLSTPEYDYHNQDWYTIAKVDQWGKAQHKYRPIYWTEPYFDEAGTFSMMMTVDAVMFDNEGKGIGMATVDWSLAQLTDALDKVKVSANAYPFFIYQGEGKFLSFPKDPKKVLQSAAQFEWGKTLLESRAQGELAMLENVVIEGIRYHIYYFRTVRGFIFGSLMPVADLEASINEITHITLIAGLAIGATFIIIMIVLMRLLFTPFDKVLVLIKGSISQASDERHTVHVRPIDYPAQNEFTPIIQALGEVYVQVSRYVKEIEDSKREIETLNTELEEKVMVRTMQLEKKTREAVIALENLQHTQEQLIENEKHAALGRLVAGVAHEINTPLGIAVTAASCVDKACDELYEMMSSGKLKRSKLEEQHQSIREGGQILQDNLTRAAELIASFKQVAVDQSSDERRQIGLASYIEKVIRSLKPKISLTEHEVRLNCDQEIDMYTQPGVLAQILTNLIDNALIHGLADKPKGFVDITVYRDSEHTVIVVADDGKGMSSEVLEFIFDPFFTTNRNRGGSGLGMHLVYNLVTQKLGGTITCDSILGQGATFTIILPDDPEIPNPTDTRDS